MQGAPLPPPDPAEREGESLLSHLVELRSRLIPSVACILLVTAALMWRAQDVYALLARPLFAVLPEGSSMIATGVASTFTAPFKLALFLGVVLSLPYVFHQAWAFVAPGLYRHERRMVLPLLIASTLLFYTGMAFAWVFVFPVVLGFFTAIAPAGVAVMTDIDAYLDFALTLLLAFGAAFEIPVLVVVLVRAGVVPVAALAAQRSWVIVGSFVVGALLTPPDVLSQVMLAVPMCLLFELGLLLARLTAPAAGERARE